VPYDEDVRGLLAAAVALEILLGPQPARAADGPRVLYSAKPTAVARTRACSTRVPLCVQAAEHARPTSTLDVLDAFERAWSLITGPLELPAPDVDPDTAAYEVFLSAPDAALLAGDLEATRLAARDTRSRIDRARSFTVVDERSRASCTLDALAARALVRASLFRSAPATDEATARAHATYLAGLAAPCGSALLADAAQEFQSEPQRAICDPHERAGVHAPDDAGGHSRGARLFADGASLVWSRLDWAYARAPGALVLAMWALAPTMTPANAPRWTNEPDGFDVLRESFKDRLSTGSTVHDLFLDVAVARAFMGSAEDGLHAPETRTLGDAARVPFDWDLPWPVAPTRVAPRVAVQPTGASYLVVRRSGAPPGARLRVEATWEEHARFLWAAVKLDARGHELGRIVIPAQERATDAQMTLVDLDAVDRILLVGANVGDPAYAFDPDERVWEPHGWLVTLAAE